MRIKVVTDSVCDIPEELIEQLDITVIPSYINIGNQSFLDGIEMTHSQFYEGLNSFPKQPTTAAPGPESFAKAYKDAEAQGYDQVISIHVSGNMSSIFQFSLNAANQSLIPVTVHDSQQLSLGAGLQVITAGKMAIAGASIIEIRRKIADLGNRTYVYALLDTLKFLHLSGRINFALRGIGSILKIKPLFTFHTGVPIYEKVRTRAKAIDRILNHIRNLGPLEHVSVVHTQALEGAKWLYQKASSFIPENNQPYFQTVTPAVGAHVGPNGIGLVCVTD
ncbi:MAG TPA: DegV family protein [Anaerolineaceae bacterium]|nr:DegV family protein [Anaerolineaceae bacterium]